jgi:uncharacterized membrane protein
MKKLNRFYKILGFIGFIGILTIFTGWNINIENITLAGIFICMSIFTIGTVLLVIEKDKSKKNKNENQTS